MELLRNPQKCIHKLYVRDHTTDNLKCLVEDLGREKWGEITSATNANVAYDTFLSAFIKIMKNIARSEE